MPEPIEQVAWAVHRACGCDGCPPHREDWQGARNAFDQVIAPLLTTARREGAEQGWDEGYRAGWENCYNEHHHSGEGLEAHLNPYRADKIAKGDDE